MYLVCVYVLILGVTNNVVISQEIAIPVEGKERGPSVHDIVWELGTFIKEYIEKYCDKPFDPALLISPGKNDEHPVYAKSLSEEPEEETLVIRRNYATQLGPKFDITEQAFRRSALNESDIEDEPLSDDEKDSILLEIEDEPKDSKSVLTAEELILNINGPEGMRRSSVTLPKDLQALISTYLKQRKRRQKKRIKVSISENSHISVSSGGKNVQFRRADDGDEANDISGKEVPQSYEVPDQGTAFGDDEVPDQNPVFGDDEVKRRFFLEKLQMEKKFINDFGTLLADKAQNTFSKPMQMLTPTKEPFGFKPVQYQYAPDPYGSSPPPAKYYTQKYGVPVANPYGSFKLSTDSKQPQVQYNVQVNKPYGSIKLSTENQPYDPKVQYNVHKYEGPIQANKPYGSMKLSIEKQPYDPKVQYNVHKFGIPVQTNYPYGSGQPYNVYQYKLPGLYTPGQAYNPYGSFRSTENRPYDPKVQYNVREFEVPRQANKPYGSFKLSTDSKQPEVQYNVQANKPYGSIKLSTGSKKPYGSIQLSTVNQPYDPNVQYNVQQYAVPGQTKKPYGSIKLSAENQPYGPEVHKFEMPGKANKPYGSIKLSTDNKQPVQYNVQQFEVPGQINKPYGSIKFSTENQPYDPKVQYKVYQYDIPKPITPGQTRKPYGSVELSVDRSKQPYGSNIKPNVYQYERPREKNSNPMKIDLPQFTIGPESLKYPYNLPVQDFLNLQQQPVQIGLNHQPVQIGLNQQPFQVGYTQYKPADTSPPQSNQYGYDYQITPADSKTNLYYPGQAYPTQYPYYIYTKHPKSHPHKHGQKKPLIPTVEYGKPTKGLYSKILQDKIFHQPPKHMDKHHKKTHKYYNMPQNEQEESDEEYAVRRLNGPNPIDIDQIQPPLETMLPNEAGSLTDEAKQKLLASVMSKIAEEFENDVQPVPLENPPREEDKREEVFRRAMTQIAEEFDKDMAEHPYAQPAPLENPPIEDQQEGQEVFRRAMTQIAEEFDNDMTEQDVQPPPLENPPIVEDQRQEVFRRAMTQIAEEFDKDMTEQDVQSENPPIEEDQRQQALSKAMTQIAQEFDKPRSDGPKQPKKDIEEVYTQAMSEIEKEFGKHMAINKPQQQTNQPSVVQAESADSDKDALKSNEEGFVYGQSVESTEQNSTNDNESSDLSDGSQQSCEETSDNEENSAQTLENQGDRRNCTDTIKKHEPSSTGEKPKSAVGWGNLIKGMFDNDNATQKEQADEDESTLPAKVNELVTEINMTEVRQFNKRPDTFTSSVGIEDFHQSDESSHSSELFGNDLTKTTEASNGGSIMSVIGNLFRPAEVERSSVKSSDTAGDGMDADNVTMYYSQVTYNHEKDTKPEPNVPSQFKASTQNINEPSQLKEVINEKWEDNESINIRPDETIGENLETGDFVAQEPASEEVDLRNSFRSVQADTEIQQEPSGYADSTPSTLTPEIIEEIATESVDTVTFIDEHASASNEEIQTIADMGKDMDYNLYYGTEDPGSYITERTTTVSTNAETIIKSEEDDYDQASITNIEDTAVDREDTTTNLEETNLEDEQDTATDEDLFYGNQEYQEHNTVVPQRRNRGEQSEEIIEDIESDPLYQKGIIFLKHKLMFEPYTDNGKYENYITKNILEKPLDKLDDREQLIFDRLVGLARHPEDLESKYAPNEYSPLNSTDNKFRLRGSLYDNLLDKDYLRKGVILLKNYPFKRKLEYSKSSPELKRLLRDFEKEKQAPTSEEKSINQLLPLLASDPEELEKVYNAIVKLHGEPDKNELAMSEQWAERLQNETGFMDTDLYNKGLELMYLYVSDHENDGKSEDDFRKFLVKLLLKKQPNEDLSEEEKRILDSLTFLYKKRSKKPLDKAEQGIVDDNFYKLGIIMLYNSPNRENLGLMGNELLESVLKKPDTELNDKEYKIYNKLMNLANNPEELLKRYYNVATSIKGEVENDNNSISQGVEFLKQYYKSNEGKQPTSPEEISKLLLENVLKKSPKEFNKRDQYVYDLLMYISQNMQLLQDFGNIEEYTVHNDMLYKTGIITIYNSPNRNNSELLAEEILQTVMKKPKEEFSFMEKKVYEYLLDTAKQPEKLVETYNNIMDDAKDTTLAEDADEEEDTGMKNKYMIAIIKIPNKPQGKNSVAIRNKTIKIVVDDLNQKITDFSGEPVSCEKMVFIMPEEHSKPLEPMNIDDEANLVHQLEYVRAQLKVNHALPGAFKEEEISERLDDIVLDLIRMLQSGFSSSVTETDQIVYDLNVFESGEDSHELLGRIILLIKKRKMNRKEVDDVELVEHLTTLERQLIKRIKSYYGTTDFKHKPVEIERRVLSEHNVDEKEQPVTEEKVASDQSGEENEEAIPLETAQRRSFFSEDQNYQDIPTGQRRGLMDTPLQMAMNVIGKWFAAQNTMQPPSDTYRRFVKEDVSNSETAEDMDSGEYFGSGKDELDDNKEVGKVTDATADPSLKQTTGDTQITRIIKLKNTDGQLRQQNEHEIKVEETPITRIAGVENTGGELKQQEEQINKQEIEDTPITRISGFENTDGELRQQNEQEIRIEDTPITGLELENKQKMEGTPITRITELENTDKELRQQNKQEIKMEDTPIIRIRGLENKGGELKNQIEQKIKQTLADTPITRISGGGAGDLRQQEQPNKDTHGVMNKEWTIKSIKHTLPRQREGRLKKRESEETVKAKDDDDKDIQLMTMHRGFSPRFMKKYDEIVQKRKLKLQQAEDEENPNIKPARRMFPLNILSTITNLLPIGGQGGQGGLGGLGNPLQILGQLNPMQFLGGGMRRSDVKSQEAENKYVTQDSSVLGQDNAGQMPGSELVNNRQVYNDEIQKYVYYPTLQQGNQQEQEYLRETMQQNDPLGTPHPEGRTSTELSSLIIYPTDN